MAKKTTKEHKKNRKKQQKKLLRDKHVLYTAAVQSVEADLDFFERVYKKKHGERFRWLKEDFCGTAALAYEWIKRRDQNHAIGVDLDRPTLDWGRRQYLSLLDDEIDRIRLIEDDVRSVTDPKVDVVAALNFSYFVFKTREALAGYFEAARRSLRPGGIFFVDTLGGTEAMEEMTENRRIPACKLPNGKKVPAFTYTWEQASFNPVDHDFQCRIHFKLPGGRRMRRAFTYDWRLWMLPEVQELMLEAGFAKTEVYVEGWDDEADDTDGIFRRRARFENQSAWVAYIVGLT
jgi:SAM-dependent methyltransferase